MSLRSLRPSNATVSCACLRTLIVFGLLALPCAYRAQGAQSLPQAQADAEVMDNDLVIRMVKEKMSAGVIVNAIRTNPGHYSLTPNSLLRLNTAGVPAAVIEAMQAKAASAPAIHNPSAAAPATSQWVTATRNDPMPATPRSGQHGPSRLAAVHLSVSPRPAISTHRPRRLVTFLRLRPTYCRAS